MESLMSGTTLFAPATSIGRGAVSIVRLSGPSSFSALVCLSRRESFRPRVASLCRFQNPVSEEILDEGLALWFPKPHSFTGEDVVELHLHGGRAVMAGVLDVLSTLPDLQPAGPGDFTRRAFENGRFDLTAAEAVADLVAAETAAQRRQALRQMDGALGRLYESWRRELLHALAHLEADIDFPDEDLPDGVSLAVRPQLQSLVSAVAAHLNDGRRGERLRDGVSVTIIGPPNAGKSSLLNILAQREAAIVSSRAGTTRDVIEVRLDLGGVPVILADTAGLRAATDEIEEEGIRRALDRAEHADLRLAVFDGSEWPSLDARTLSLVDRNTICVVNKCDLLPEPTLKELPAIAAQPVLAVSARLGAGVPTLMQWVQDRVAEIGACGAEPLLTRARHRHALEECHCSLLRAISGSLSELVAEDVRLAARALGKITGRVDVEEILDVIFRDFCIGK
ncbi:tRNA modification GTPase MnmE [Azospirillaceae bacterium]